MKPETADSIRAIFVKGLELSTRPEGPGGRLSDARPGLLNHLSVVKSADREPWPITYALSCWLDELLTRKAAPGESTGWEVHTLEWQLFASRNRATVFWEMADQAITAAHSPSEESRDVLSVFASCIRFGFIGERSSAVDRAAWLDHATPLLLSSVETEQPRPRPAASEPSLLGMQKLLRSYRYIWFPVAAAALLGLGAILVYAMI